MASIRAFGRILAAALLLAAAAPTWAQVQNGNLYGTVHEEQGAPLQGVTVTLSGDGVPAVQVTNEQGRFRFLGLAPGRYDVEARRDGYSPLAYPNIVVSVGRNVTIEVILTPAVEQVITVSAESPLLDERKIAPSTTISHVELQRIPSARDPWSILQRVPGVLTDRINIGGSESGQQAQLVGPGTGGGQAVWSVDGVNITDMAVTGSSPTSYDFDSFEEMQVTTGGSDAAVATGGVVLNMVTRRGTDEWRGSARFLATDDAGQSSTSFDETKLAPGQPPFRQGNRIVQILDHGGEGGGPVVADRLWIWGSYGVQEIGLLTINDVSDDTRLENVTSKLNLQLTEHSSATAFFLSGNKIKHGRNAGPTRPQPTTWDQDAPTELYKLEGMRLFGSDLFLTGLASYLDSTFAVVPQGGLEINSALDQDFVWQNSFVLMATERPQAQYRLDGSWFFGTGDLNHELRFGAGHREAEVDSLSRWPGIGIQLDYYKSYGYPFNVINLIRDSGLSYTGKNRSAYAQDTLTLGSLTANIGLRYDLQGGTNDARRVRANPGFPEILPAVDYRGGDIGFEWETITPRLGLTYALGERKTLLRASYSQFADQLGSGVAAWLNPLYPGAYTYFYYDDRNGDGLAQPEEVLVDLGSTQPFNLVYNPFQPEVPLLSNQVDPGLEAPLTHEILLGAEHAFLPDFVVGLNLTYRRLTDLLEAERLVFEGDAFSAENVGRLGRPHRREDYVPVTRLVTLPNGQRVEVTAWQLRPGLSSRDGGRLENGEREQVYRGASLTLNKRLSRRWMLRGNVTVQDWEWDVPESEREDPTRLLGQGNQDGAPVLQGSGTGSGSKGAVYIGSDWSYAVTGMVQIAPERPWSFNVALSANGREGYPLPYFRRFFSLQGIPANVNVEATPRPETFRVDDIHLLDLRIEKEFTLRALALTLGFDVFNLTNEAYVLQRQHQLQQSNTDNVLEITNPRIVRVGARVSFQ